MGISYVDVLDAVASNNENTGGSYIEKNPYTYFIRGEGLLKGKDEIEQILVQNETGTPILIKDIASVKLGHAPRFGAVTMDGKGEVVSGQVMMLKGENSATVIKEVKKRIEQIQDGLPVGVRLEPFLDRSKLINRTTKTVLTNLIEGGLIVIFVLVLLLGNLRAGLIVASVIPLSMLFAVSMMRIFGVSANLMSLGAIDFGLIVDGAVIIVEATLHHLGVRKSQHKLSQAEMDAEVLESASRTRTAAAFGEIIILIVYLPILFLTGIEGKMFQPMAQTVSFAILGALLLSLTYVPMMSALALSKKPLRKESFSDKIIAFIYKLYRPVLKLGLKLKLIFLALTLGIFVLSLLTLRNMGAEFIPTLEEGDFALHQILPTGSSLSQGVEVSAELQKILLENFPEVEKVVTKIGTSEIPVDIMPLEAGDIFVILKPKEEWTSGKTKEELFEKMNEAMSEFPGVIYEFTQPIQMRFNELMTGIRQDIAIKIYGEELGLLVQKAQQAKVLIEDIQGISEVQVEAIAGLQQMKIAYDRKKIAQYGLDIQSLNRILRGSFAGEFAGVLYEGEKRFDIVVRLDSSFRKGIDDIESLFIPLPNGRQIPISEVADIRFEEGPAQISRDNTQRRIVLGVNARGRDIASLVAEIKRTLQFELDLPAGYYVTYGGQFENLERAQKRLMIAVPLALALIFILLFFTFGSIKQAVLIFTAIPMSAIGGIWALYLRGMPFSISAGVGFIALFGVAVLNGIVLIAYFNHLKKEGMSDLTGRIMEGTHIRMRPVIMTALVASLGFLPMAISTAPGAEVQQPLATVVIGGLITATFLTLVILPILYFYSEKSKR
jgi:cobalt-zinc-cadmium resistance protein CzcA